VTVRLDPKLRYLAELAARSHRRTLSSWIEWSIKASVDQELLPPSEATSVSESLGAASKFLWDVDESGRLAQLALHFPSLLTFEEQVIWKLIKTNGYFWRGEWSDPSGEWRWAVNHESLIDYRVQQHWELICDVARTGEGHDRLPKWERYKRDRASRPIAANEGSPE